MVVKSVKHSYYYFFCWCSASQLTFLRPLPTSSPPLPPSLPLLPAPSSSPLPPPLPSLSCSSSPVLFLLLLSPFSSVMELLTHCSRPSAGRSLALIPLIPPQISSLHIHLTAAGRHHRDLCDAVIIHHLLPACERKVKGHSNTSCAETSAVIAAHKSDRDVEASEAAAHATGMGTFGAGGQRSTEHKPSPPLCLAALPLLILAGVPSTSSGPRSPVVGQTGLSQLSSLSLQC